MGRRLRETFHILKPSILDRISGAYVRLIHFLYKQKRGRFFGMGFPDATGGFDFPLPV